MTQTTTPPDRPRMPRRSVGAAGVLPRVLIVAAVVLVLARAGALRGDHRPQITRTSTAASTCPPTPHPGPAARPDEAAARDRDPQLRAARLRQPRPEQRGHGRSDTIMVVHLNASGTRPTSSRSRATCTSTSRATARTRSTPRSPSAVRRSTVRTLEQLTGRPDEPRRAGQLRRLHRPHDDLGGVTVATRPRSPRTASTTPRARSPSRARRRCGSSASGTPCPTATWTRREPAQRHQGDRDQGAQRRGVSDPARFTTFIANLARHVTVDNSLTDGRSGGRRCRSG